MKMQFMVTIGNMKIFQIIVSAVIDEIIAEVPVNCNDVCGDCKKCIMKRVLPHIATAVMSQDISDELMIYERRKSLENVDKSRAIASFVSERIVNTMKVSELECVLSDEKEKNTN